MIEPAASRSGIRSRTAGAILAVVGLVAGAWLLVNSRFFVVDRVVVRGVSEVSSGEILDLAAVPDGANLIRLSTEEVAGRVEAHPWVADAIVTRDLPSTLGIDVIERRPVAYIDAGNGAEVIAADGVLLERLPGPPSVDLPRIEGIARTTRPGELLQAPPEALRIAATMPADLLGLALSVTDGPDGWITRLRGGERVVYGSRDALVAKHDATLSILAWAEGEGMVADVIDVSIPSAPTVRPARGDLIEVPENATTTTSND